MVIDTAYTVHPDTKSHTGGTMTMGKDGCTDYFTKPLQGSLFRKMRAYILNLPIEGQDGSNDVDSTESTPSGTTGVC